MLGFIFIYSQFLLSKFSPDISSAHTGYFWCAQRETAGTGMCEICTGPMHPVGCGPKMV